MLSLPTGQHVLHAARYAAGRGVLPPPVVGLQSGVRGQWRRCLSARGGTLPPAAVSHSLEILMAAIEQRVQDAVVAEIVRFGDPLKGGWLAPGGGPLLVAGQTVGVAVDLAAVSFPVAFDVDAFRAPDAEELLGDAAPSVLTVTVEVIGRGNVRAPGDGLEPAVAEAITGRDVVYAVGDHLEALPNVPAADGAPLIAALTLAGGELDTAPGDDDAPEIAGAFTYTCFLR